MSDELRQVTLFDTRSHDKRPFEPQEAGKVKLYVCGVTVYDLTHIGHARVFVFFDVVQRFLRHLGYEVLHVRNHTDVDDKIVKRAAEAGVDPLELSARFIEELDRDFGALGIEKPDVEPKVSDHIAEIIEIVEKLVEAGYGYEVEGDVYYRVERFEGYGKLSGRKLEDMEAGRSGRVDEAEESKKEHPFDFALWKSSAEDQLGWDSPWGRGRPGWHIECSAMSMRYLGEGLDIHGGGRDLIFPHHENEIAQSEAASGHAPFANYWMHVGMVNVAETVDGEQVERKMSKSLGNFWTTRDVLKGYHPEAIRYFFHTTLYRKPITYAVEQLEEATNRTEYLYTTQKRIDEVLGRGGWSAEKAPPKAVWSSKTAATMEGFWERFEAALADDFNTPKALAILGEMAKIGNELTQAGGEPSPEVAWTIYQVSANLFEAGRVLGLLQREPEVALEEIRDLRLGASELDPEAIDKMIAARKQARADKDWEEADRLRDELDALGVEIMDSPQGTTWRMK